MSDSKELATTNGGALATADFGDFAGQGFEDVGRDEILIPFISVLQAISPQLDQFDDAKAGMLYNSVTDVRTPGAEGITLVPAFRKHVVLEFKPDRGGFVAEHDVKDPAMQAIKAANGGNFYEATTEDGNDLVESFQVYVVLCDSDGEVEGFACLPFSASKVKVFKKWHNAMLMYKHALPDGKRVQPPMFSHLTKLTTVQETNAKGEKYYNFVLSPANGERSASIISPVNDQRALAARELIELVGSGAAKVDQNAEAGGAESQAAGDDDIPF